MSTTTQEEIQRQLEREGWSLSKQGWSSLWNSHAGNKQRLRDNLLCMDLRNIGQGVVKAGLQRKQLEAPVVLQVLERRNISVPQQQRRTTLHLEKAKLEGQLWMDKVSDGETTLTAVEDEVLVELHQIWKPGIKIAIVQPLVIFHGVVFVTRRDIKVLGGGFGHTDDEKEQSRERLEAVELTTSAAASHSAPLFEPFQQHSMRRPDRLVFAGFDIDAFVFQGELRTINRTRTDRLESSTMEEKPKEQLISIDQKAKHAMLDFLQSLQARKKKQQKPVFHKVESTTETKQREPQMSVERGIQRLTNTLQQFTIQGKSHGEKLNSAQQSDETNGNEAQEIIRSFYSSRQQQEKNTNTSRTYRRGSGRGRGRGGRGRSKRGRS